jgi:hypothetical protein
MSRIDGYEQASLPSILSAGDTVAVTKTNGDRHYIELVSVSDDTIVGTHLPEGDSGIVSVGAVAGSGITISADDIASIELETIDGAKTTLAIAGGIVLLPFAILGLFMGAAAGDL